MPPENDAPRETPAVPHSPPPPAGPPPDAPAPLDTHIVACADQGRPPAVQAPLPADTEGEVPHPLSRDGSATGVEGAPPAGPLLLTGTATAGGEGPPPPPASRIARFRAWRFAPIVEVIGTIAVALALAESVQAAVVKPFVIPSQSMQPTLLPGQRVLVNRLAYDFGSSPARGDIVVFHPPASLVCKINVPVTEPCPASDAKRSSQYFVKRVMGLPGDHLWIEDGHPVINGKEIRKEPYITSCANSTSCNMPHVITIPPGEYYMLGDNRGDSDDSRYWGPVPASWIIGEVFVTYWPPDRIGIF